MMLADAAFDLPRPSRRWLLLLSLFGHALVIASVVGGQLLPDRLARPQSPPVRYLMLVPPPPPGPVCRNWSVKGDTPYCARHYELPREPVQLDCSTLSPEVLRALRTWPYRGDPCAMWRKATRQVPDGIP